jgi:hypothetical protein
MEVNIHSMNKCEAILSNKNKKCTYKKKYGIFCTRHHNLYTKKKNLDEMIIKAKNNRQKKIKIKIKDFKFNRIVKNKFYLKNYFIPSIIKLQSIVRKFLIKKLIKKNGLGSVLKNINNNETDCFTLEKIKNITSYKLFSYKDDKNFVWGFHLETFAKIIENKLNNPYNMQKIPKYIILKFLNIHRKKDKKEYNYENLPQSIKLQQKCVKIFQKMNDLKQYSQCKWFLSLNIYRLRELYKQIEDIWNYRAQLTNADKFKYIENGKLFQIPVENIYKLNNKIKLGNILLDEFDKLVSEGKTEADRTTGALWILSSLTIVNKSARDALPWLFQSANVY